MIGGLLVTYRQAANMSCIFRTSTSSTIHIKKKWIYHIRVFYISFSYLEYMLNLSTPRDYNVIPT